MSELIPLAFKKIMQSKSYTIFILESENKQFAIYTDPNVGIAIQTYVTERIKPRPFTHDLINAIVQGLDIRVTRIVLYDVQETTYFAKLYLEQDKEGKTHVLEIDARPSDCFTLALMNKIPVYCNRAVLEQAIAVEE